ncbi:nickel-binding protein [Nonomuraea sp. NPDC005650]|uniref:nickel-binding protein n=1 Tax=Nonomuraea sp. NPDC005650 TaxID=3157045 RepID=UPI0033B79798
MAIFLTLHQAPGLSSEEVAGYAPEVAQGVHATFRNLYVNFGSGFIATVYEAENRDAVEQEFERIGFPFEKIHEIDHTLDAEQVAAIAGGAL